MSKWGQPHLSSRRLDIAIKRKFVPGDWLPKIGFTCACVTCRRSVIPVASSKRHEAGAICAACDQHGPRPEQHRAADRHLPAGSHNHRRGRERRLPAAAALQQPARLLHVRRCACRTQSHNLCLSAPKKSMFSLSMTVESVILNRRVAWWPARPSAARAKLVGLACDRG